MARLILTWNLSMNRFVAADVRRRTAVTVPSHRVADRPCWLGGGTRSLDSTL